MANLKFHNQEFAANNNPSSVNSNPKPGTLVSNSSSSINSSSPTPTISVTNVAPPNGAAAANPHQFSNYQHRDLFQVHCQAHNRRLSIKGSQLLNKYMTKKSSSSLLKTTSVAVLALLFCVFSSILLVHLILPNTLKSTRLSDSVGSSISPLHHTNLDDLRSDILQKHKNQLISNWTHTALKPNLTQDSEYIIEDTDLISNNQDSDKIVLTKSDVFENLVSEELDALNLVVKDEKSGLQMVRVNDLEDFNEIAYTISKKSKNAWDDLLILLSFFVLSYFVYLFYISRILHSVFCALVGLVRIPFSSVLRRGKI